MKRKQKSHSWYEIDRDKQVWICTHGKAGIIRVHCPHLKVKDAGNV